jgi:hypothetical protein
VPNTSTDRFIGRYITADIVTPEESKNLSSNESVVGAEVQLVFERKAPLEDADDAASRADSTDTTEEAKSSTSAQHKGKPSVRVESMRGYSLGTFDSSTSYKLTRAHESGLVCRAYVSAVIFAEEHQGFWGEYAIICYPVEEQDIWNIFCDNAAQAIARGDHPDIKLTDKEIARVRNNNGAWSDFESMQYAKLPKGAVYFKKKRSVADSLVNNAVTGNKGCKVAGILFWIAVALVIVIVIWVYVLQ